MQPTRRLGCANSPRHWRSASPRASARRHAQISQEQLAGRLHKHQPFVSEVENGERLLDLLEYLRWATEIDADPMELLKDLVAEVEARGRLRKRTQLKVDQ
ncbi:helix-turn-helix transcriptional regulator [Ramlibacter ginsenosidimutans]|uniref:helix-turn-helix domain-containing protein n=1 Tax=Ramlibacter ginsenosidimutans TaxID=502333 RepID=UPI0030F42103